MAAVLREHDQTQRLDNLRAQLLDLADLGELLKPYAQTAERRLPKDVGDGLIGLEETLRNVLADIYHEGVAYGDDERDRQLARGRVPVEGTADGEDGWYRETTAKERREAILNLADTSKAINEAASSFHALRGMGRLLQQDAINDEPSWVLSIAHMVVEETERMVEFLDRPGGWPGPEGSAS